MKLYRCLAEVLRLRKRAFSSTIFYLWKVYMESKDCLFLSIWYQKTNAFSMCWFRSPSLPRWLSLISFLRKLYDITWSVRSSLQRRLNISSIKGPYFSFNSFPSISKLSFLYVWLGDEAADRRRFRIIFIFIFCRLDIIKEWFN